MNPWFRQEFLKELGAQLKAVEGGILNGSFPDHSSYMRAVGERRRIMAAVELFETLYVQMENRE